MWGLKHLSFAMFFLRFLHQLQDYFSPCKCFYLSQLVSEAAAGLVGGIVAPARVLARLIALCPETQWFCPGLCRGLLCSRNDLESHSFVFIQIP